MNISPARPYCFMVMLLLLGLAGCASYAPVAIDELNFLDRLETEEQDDLRVSVAVLSREEARQAFGVNLEKRNIQAVWVEIENRSGKDFWFMLSGLDPNYFSAHEAAYMNHFRFGGKANDQMDRHFSDLGIDPFVESGRTRRGFVFANETIGTREVRVRLFSEKDVRTFEMFVAVPGAVSDWDRQDLQLIAENIETEVETDAELREALRQLPCCTQKQDGSGKGDPINLVLIGNETILKAFITSGWDETLYREDLRTFFGAAYLYGRVPDVQFQKARRRVDSINLVRLWISPIRYRGKIVVVGTVERNIDPNVDAAANYLVQDLATAEFVDRYALVDGVGVVSRSDPRRDLFNAPYWTDGNRVVIEIAERPVPFEAIRYFDWEWEIRRLGGGFE